jgi:hypothetical protein
MDQVPQHLRPEAHLGKTSSIAGSVHLFSLLIFLQFLSVQPVGDIFIRSHRFRNVDFLGAN